MADCVINHQKWPPCFLHAETEDAGVTVRVLVNVAPNVIVFVVVAKVSLSRVFVGVGRVMV